MHIKVVYVLALRQMMTYLFIYLFIYPFDAEQCTHRITGRWLQFTNDAAYVSVKCEHSCTALGGFFPFAFSLSVSLSLSLF